MTLEYKLERLDEKVQEEYEHFRLHLQMQPAEVVYNYAYKIYAISCIMDVIEQRRFDTDYIDTLYYTPQLLETLYQAWLNGDTYGIDLDRLGDFIGAYGQSH